jgi:hypothetical protein
VSTDSPSKSYTLQNHNLIYIHHIECLVLRFSLKVLYFKHKRTNNISTIPQDCKVRFSLKVLYLFKYRYREHVRSQMLLSTDSPSKSYTFCNQREQRCNSRNPLSTDSPSKSYTFWSSLTNNKHVLITIWLRFSLKVIHLSCKEHSEMRKELSSLNPDSPSKSYTLFTHSTITESLMRLRHSRFSLKVLYFVSVLNMVRINTQSIH